MELKLNDWKVKFLKLAYCYNDFELPKSLCFFFWQFIFALVLLPISFPLFLLNKFTGSNFKHFYSIFVVFFGTLMFTSSLILPNAGHDPSAFQIMCRNHLFLTTLASTWTTYIFFSIVLIIIFIGISIKDAIDNFQEKYRDKKQIKVIKEKSPNIFIEWLKVKKQKMCPIIKYKE